MSSAFAFIFSCVLYLFIRESYGLSLENVYSKFIDRETIDQSDIFGFNVPRPVAYKGGEPIWPRSYSSSGEFLFDENGAAFPVRPRKKLGNIRRPLGLTIGKYDDDDDDNDNDENIVHKKRRTGEEKNEAILRFIRRFRNRN